MKVRYFEDLEVWKASRILTNRVYEITNNQKFGSDFGLVDQIRRATVSIMSNIAEGYERGGNQEFIQFLFMAKGSCGEVRSQLYIAKDQKYISDSDFNELMESAKKISIMISNFIEYLKGSRMTGRKYKKEWKTSKELVDELLLEINEKTKTV